MSNSPKAKETPAQTIKRLEREIEDEQLRNRLLNTVVDILDAEHGMNLRKKYMAKERDAFKLKKKSVYVVLVSFLASVGKRSINKSSANYYDTTVC